MQREPSDQSRRRKAQFCTDPNLLSSTLLRFTTLRLTHTISPLDKYNHPKKFETREMASGATWRLSVSPSNFARLSLSFRTKRRQLPLRTACTVRSEVSLSVGVRLIPHPRKIETGGEDAFFVSGENGVLAVADGVSGWAERNVNPALFSRQLMSHASNFFADEEINCDPQILLRKSHEATTSVGSATVLFAMLEKNGTLKIANVGDCGLRIIRKGRVIFATCPQEHYFDCPYQISSESNGQTYEDATVCSIKLKEQDIIVMGSDGLFDNVFDREIITEISNFQDMTEAAKGLAELASNHSRDFYFDSPFSAEARTRGFDVKWWEKLLGKKLTGGKLDDITVIVAQVVKASTEQHS
ncbi:Protein phosphatase 2C [Rhynchospora pubera]|uniref:Protein phosphatase n=1 Tax=Rhynchospora pubera TaxID=906938 RepID=A0AAV8H0M2_9POAL|nr:Protein phosphatase 2C [Rhynchospora pubera]